MSVFFCRLADLILGIETPPGHTLSSRNVDGFQTEPIQPDILFRFHPQDIGSLRAISQVKEEIETLSRQFRCFNGHWGVPFLAAGNLRRLLRSMQTDADLVTLELLDSIVRIQNFSARTLDVFHPGDLSADAIFNRQGEFFLAPFLARFQAMILHGSAVVRGERAVLFLGPDAAGKTTAATSQSTGPILCDDQVILRWDNECFHAFGTPWGRIYQSAVTAPLGALILLEKADDFSLTPVSPIEMFTHIWDEHPYYHLPLPLKFRPEAFDLVHRLCRSVPLFRMRFGIRSIDWSAIDQVLARLT